MELLAGEDQADHLTWTSLAADYILIYFMASQNISFRVGQFANFYPKQSYIYS